MSWVVKPPSLSSTLTLNIPCLFTDISIPLYSAVWFIGTKSFVSVSQYGHLIWLTSLLVSLQELFNAASTIIADLAIVPATIAIAHKRAKHILASITAAKLYQLIGIHSGYFSFDFLEISHRINLLYLSNSSRDTRGGISSYVSAVQFSLHNTYSPFVDNQPRLILHPQRIRAD